MESDDELEQGSETFKIGWFVGVDLETQRYISIQRWTIHSVEAIERVIAFEEDIVCKIHRPCINEFGLEEEFMENLENFDGIFTQGIRIYLKNVEILNLKRI